MNWSLFASLPRTLWLVLTLLALSAPPIARAESSADSQARQHFELGRDYFSRALYSEAYREFEQAYQLSGRAALLINMSRALEAARDIKGAIAPLEQWLTQAPSDDPIRDEVIYKLSRLSAEAERLDPEQVNRAAQASPAPSEQSAAAAPSAPPAQPVPESPRSWLRPTGIALLASGLALAGAGTALVFVGRSAIDNVEQAPVSTKWREVESDYEQGPRRTSAGIALLSTGAAVLVGGAALTLLGRRKRHELKLSAAHGAALLSGRF